MRWIDPLTGLVQEQEIKQKHNNRRKCREAQVDTSIAQLTMLQSCTNRAKHNRYEYGRDNEEQHFFTGIAVALLSLFSEWRVHEGGHDHLGGEEGPEEWLQEVIVLPTLKSSYLLEPAEDSNLRQAEAEEETGEEGEAGRNNIIALLVRLNLHFREVGQDECKSNQCDREQGSILGEGESWQADVLEELRLLASKDHPEFDSEGEDCWCDAAENDQDDVAHVSDVDQLKCLNKEADADSNGRCYVEEGPCVTTSNLKNIVFQRDKWQLQRLFLKIFELVLQFVERQLEDLLLLLLVSGLTTIFAGLVLAVEEGLLTLNLKLQFIDFLELMLHQLFSLAFDFDDDDASDNKQGKPVDCIEGLHLVLSIELDHEFCIKGDDGEDNHGKHQQHQTKYRTNLTFTFLILLWGECGLRQQFLPISPRIRCSTTTFIAALNLQVGVLL